MSVLSDIGQFIKNGLASVPKFLREKAQIALKISGIAELWLKSSKVQNLEKILDPFTQGMATEAINDVVTFIHVVDGILVSIGATDSHVSDEHVKLVKQALLQKIQSHATALQDGQKEDQQVYDKASQAVYSKEGKEQDKLPEPAGK